MESPSGADILVKVGLRRLRHIIVIIVEGPFSLHVRRNWSYRQANRYNQKVLNIVPCLSTLAIIHCCYSIPLLSYYRCAFPGPRTNNIAMSVNLLYHVCIIVPAAKA
jgi:hypothetical protein